MVWLTNTYDPKREDAKYTLSVRIDRNRDIEWGRHLVWLARCEIGRPRATKEHDVEALEAMGLVGVYELGGDA